MENLAKCTCQGYSSDGRGLVTVDGYTFPVRGLLKGEEAMVIIRPQGKGQFAGEIKELLKASPSRVLPVCPDYASCGGCALQHMSYEKQLVFKKNLVQSELDKQGIIFDVKPCLGMKDPYKYRNKVQSSYSMDYKGRVIGGFYVEGTHQIIDIDQCYLEREEADQIVNFFKTLLEKYEIDPYDRSSNYGSVRHVVVRSAFKTNQVMVIIVTKTPELPHESTLIKDLVAKFPNITSIVHNINERPGNAVFGERDIVIYGPSYLEEELSGLKFHIAPQSFFQVNPVQTEQLYAIAIADAKLTGTEEVLDAYCGIGTIGLIAAKNARHVTGVEVVGASISSAQANARLNGITNSHFYCEDATVFVRDALKDGRHFDVVFVDPPRSGCDFNFISALKAMKPSRIVYVSCEPSTLARDLALLKTDYDIKDVQPVDMFPQTFHVETCVLLSLKESHIS